MSRDREGAEPWRGAPQKTGKTAEGGVDTHVRVGPSGPACAGPGGSDHALTQNKRR